MARAQKRPQKYIPRSEVLTRHGFDLTTDIKRNVWGALELTGDKPESGHDINVYLCQRNEDADSL